MFTLYFCPWCGVSMLIQVVPDYRVMTGSIGSYYRIVLKMSPFARECLCVTSLISLIRSPPRRKEVSFAIELLGRLHVGNIPYCHHYQFETLTLLVLDCCRMQFEPRLMNIRLKSNMDHIRYMTTSQHLADENVFRLRRDDLIGLMELYHLFD